MYQLTKHKLQRYSTQKFISEISLPFYEFD